ncbi:MAG: DUF1822 family protein [Stigonema ocellatum SAG 48.90 = DSM 106950]|nr:DUF1822 family protein [Stigonema ocellatum SAG 48.90 = DSM 106950]
MKALVYSQYSRRKLSQKIILLESEHFEEAQKTSDQNLGEACQWKIYLNTLALLGFEQWLRERIPDMKINRDHYSIFKSENGNLFDVVCHLNLGDFRLCIITVDNLIDDFVTLPVEVIKTPKLASHFYVLIEVLEEKEELKIYGFLRYDQLIKYCQSIHLNAKTNSCYQLALSCFDTEINNLLLSSRFLSETAILLPSVAEVNNTAIQPLTQATNIVTKALVNLSNWCLGVFEDGWQSTQHLQNILDSNYTWGVVRSQSLGYHHSGGKIIDFGLQLNGQPLALVVNLKPLENNDEVDVLVQVVPCYEEPCSEEYLPPGLKLKVTLNPNTAELVSQEVTARLADNAIQLEFSEAPGKQFQVEVSLLEAVVTEKFLL